jgi:lipopolysaccharide/colanic/teichoic acid biosynthesis glycosyltransferase
MESSSGFRMWILGSDLVWLTISMLSACLMRYGSTLTTLPNSTLLVFSVTTLEAAIMWIFLWTRFGLDGFRGGWRFPAVLSQLLVAVSVLMVTVLASGYLFRAYVSRLVAAYFGVTTVMGFVLIRVAAHLFFDARRRSGLIRRVVIVGSGPVARELAEKIENHPEALLEVSGFLCAEESFLGLVRNDKTPDISSLQTTNVIELLRQRGIDEIIFAVPLNAYPQISDLMERCKGNGIAVSIIPQPYELYLSSPELIDLAGIPVLRLRQSHRIRPEPIWKRVFDLLLAPLFFLVSLPVLCCAALPLVLTRGKAFCREERCGKEGRAFWMYRLNSPRHAPNLPIYERLMQQLSLTELPQLFNVLRGDMSLVGPRPELAENLRHYTEWHRWRMNVKPGITGLAQVHGLRDEHSLENKTRYDLQYILHRTLFQDLSILVQTIWTLSRRLVRMPKQGASSSGQSASTTSIAA